MGDLLSKGKAAARTLTHARILLKADEGEAGPRLSDEAIAEALEVNRSTVNGSASGVSRKGSRRRCIRVLRASCIRASSTAPKRRTWSRWHAVLHQRDGRVRVRMALHTGEADLREGDYYGCAVNRCARLRGLAYGCQTLLSATTASTVRGALPPGASLRDLGTHALRGLARPERVAQLMHPDLLAEFPPPGYRQRSADDPVPDRLIAQARPNGAADARRHAIASAAQTLLASDAAPRPESGWMRHTVVALWCVFLVVLELAWLVNARGGAAGLGNLAPSSEGVIVRAVVPGSTAESGWFACR